MHWLKAENATRNMTNMTIALLAVPGLAPFCHILLPEGADRGVGPEVLPGGNFIENVSFQSDMYHFINIFWGQIARRPGI